MTGRWPGTAKNAITSPAPLARRAVSSSAVAAGIIGQACPPSVISVPPVPSGARVRAPPAYQAVPSAAACAAVAWSPGETGPSGALGAPATRTRAAGPGSVGSRRSSIDSVTAGPKPAPVTSTVPLAFAWPSSSSRLVVAVSSFAMST